MEAHEDIARLMDQGLYVTPQRPPNTGADSGPNTGTDETMDETPRTVYKPFNRRVDARRVFRDLQSHTHTLCPDPCAQSTMLMAALRVSCSGNVYRGDPAVAMLREEPMTEADLVAGTFLLLSHECFEYLDESAMPL